MTITRTWTGRVTIGVSLDGFIARPDGDIAWLLDPPAGRDHANVDSSVRAQSWDEFFPGIDHVLMGGGTYDTVATFDEWPYEGKTVIVLSTTLGEDDSRITVVRSLPEAAQLLNERGAGQVYVDGGQTIQAALRAGLIDEITISWAPILLGTGRPLFAALDHDVLLTLQGTHATPDGMVHATYRVQSRGLLHG